MTTDVPGKSRRCRHLKLVFMPVFASHASCTCNDPGPTDSNGTRECSRGTLRTQEREKNNQQSQNNKRGKVNKQIQEGKEKREGGGGRGTRCVEYDLLLIAP